MSTQNFGWKKQEQDARDYVHFPDAPAPTPPVTWWQRLCAALFPRKYTTPAIPSEVKPLTSTIPAFTQGALNSCTANAWVRAALYCHLKAGITLPMLSRLFLYYCERDKEGTVSEDCGAMLRTGAKVLAGDGVCPESLWPYEVDKVCLKPSDDAVAAALSELALVYEAVPLTGQDDVDIETVKKVLAGGYPIVFGFFATESFLSEEVAKSGIMKMPTIGEKEIGGHAAVIDGYKKDGMLVVNSWGPDWGILGGFLMPWANIKNCYDMWVLRKMQ